MARKFVCTKTEPVVQTKQGKLRGFQVDGVYTFHGIKYADAQRFQMPVEPQKWEGIKDALAYGYVCPLLSQDTPYMEVMVPHRYWPADENCQYLNIWTQSVDPQDKKPVMVWLHGGGFSAGSSIEQVAYEGDHLCEYGDVVVVSLNHRLNILGYLNLADYGEKYANSGNAGNADIVAALKWIHENIAAFGGNPDNVTLFGQSGGGMKVWSLMNTPAADGLFHKGIIQSGLLDGVVDVQKTDAGPVVHSILKELGFGGDEVWRLESVPYQRLAEAYNKVAPGLAAQGEYVGGAPMPNEFYVGDPRKKGFTEHAKTIPVLVGTVFGEFDFGPGITDKYHLPADTVMEMLKKRFGDLAEDLAEEFKTAYPTKNLTDILSLDTFFRIPTKDFIEKKSRHKEAPTYSYLFTYEFPLDDGKPAWHCSELPFIFHNTDRVPVCNIPGVSDRLEEKMAGSWIHFARYGTPQTASLPQWPVCEPGNEAVMLFDVKCEVKHNHDNALMELMKQVNLAFPLGQPADKQDGEAVILH